MRIYVSKLYKWYYWGKSNKACWSNTTNSWIDPKSVMDEKELEGRTVDFAKELRWLKKHPIPGKKK